MLREDLLVPENPTVVMKDHAFDRDLDDLGMSPEDLEREVDPELPSAPAPQEIVLRH
jgi:hypothetical protein